MKSKKILLIGGHPKGYDVPFHQNTRSGKILRGILSKNGIKAKIIDLWKNEEEQKTGLIASKVISLLDKYKKGYYIVALGRWVESSLVNHGVNCIYFSHPASRRSKDRLTLERKLIGLNKIA